MSYNYLMREIRSTAEFNAWFAGLKDRIARIRIQQRIERAQDGNYGDHKRFSGLLEMRIRHGAGYRVYCVEHGDRLTILLVGGDKSTQKRDIKRALELAQNL